MHNVFFPSLREFRMKISSQKGERHFTSLKVKKEKCKKTCFKTSPYRSGEIAMTTVLFGCCIWCQADCGESPRLVIDIS